MRRFLLLFACVLLAHTTSAEAFDPNTSDATAVRALAAEGQLVIAEERPDGSLKLVTGGTLVKATPEAVWALISNYAGYSEWMPQTKKVEVVNETADYKDVRFVLDFKFSVITKNVKYTLRKREEPPYRIRWYLLDGDFKASTGAWHLVPVDGGQHTLVFYSTWTDLESMGWIVKELLEEQPSMEIAMLSSTAAMVVKAVKEQLEK